MNSALHPIGKWLKPAVFLWALVPLALMLVQILQNNLGPDPAQELAKVTGEWTIRFLLLVLALTPLRHLTGITQFARHRRMLGLFALFYATIHLLVWMSFLLSFRWLAIGEELTERPYITVGFVAYVILLALGVTSPKVMVRRLGRNWKKLHQLIYIAGVLAVVHLLWILRTDVWEAVVYGSVLAMLLGFRFIRYLYLHRS